MLGWKGAVILKILIGNVAAPWIMKKVASKHSRTRRFALQFGFCALFALSLAGILRQLPGNYQAVAIFAVGFFNGTAAYAQWKAIHISLSKNSLFTFLDDIIAMVLSGYFLSDRNFLNGGILSGAILSLSAAVLFARNDYQKMLQKNAETGSSRIPLRFYLYVLYYSIVWGVAAFFKRYWGLEGIGKGTFLASWYGGAFLASLLILKFYNEPDEKESKRTLTRRDISEVMLLSAIVMSTLFLAYWAYGLAPLVVLQPIFLVAEMIFPALLGLFVFQERGSMSLREWGYFGIGLLGGIAVVLNYGG